MPYKKNQFIGKLMNRLFHTTPYYEQWLASKIMEGCKRAVPVIEGKIAHFYIKNRILYIKLSSAVLAHELRLNKNRLMSHIQKEACNSLEENIKLESMVENIVFL